MEDWFASLLGASFIPAVAFVLRRIIAKQLNARTKDVVTTDDRGRSETLVVSATAGPTEIRKHINEAYSFEAEIGKALEEIGRKQQSLRTHSSRKVDFIVDLPNGKLAVEVKLALDRIDERAMERYLSAESNLRHLLLVSRTPPPPKVLETIKRFVNESRVSLVTIPSGSDPTPLIEKAIGKIATPHREPLIN